MNIQFETPNAPTEGILRIAIDQTDLQPRIDKKLKELGQRVSLKGFRPGKVPPQLVKKMLGQDVLVQEMNTLLSDTINEYFDNNKEVSLLGQPVPLESEEPIDLKRPETYKFSFRCGIVPAFSYDLSKLYVQDYEVIVDDEIVNKTVEQLRREHGKFGSAEFTSTEDIIKGVLYDTQHDYSIEANIPKDNKEQQEGEATEIDETKFYTETFLPLDRISASEMPKFLNVSVGTIVHFDIKNLMADPEKGLQLLTGKKQEELDKLEGEFAFEIKEIMHNALADLNEDFYKKVFGREITSEEEFRAAIKEDTEKYYEGQNLALKKRQAHKQLVENTEMELPHEFLKEFFVKRNKNTTPEKIEEDYPNIEKSVRWELLAGKLNENYAFDASDEEVRTEAVRALMSMYGQYGQSNEIYNYIASIADDYAAKNYNALAQDIISNKILDAIVQDLVAPKQIVSTEEFLAIYNAA